ncbi:MAG: glycoside hydrolase family 15 protein [Planctomycetota bacterium]
MPRDIPVGNGQLLVTFDHHYRVRDLYFPHVGQENHAGGPCRFGVWGQLPGGADGKEERRKARVYWSDDGWDTSLKYHADTLATDVTMRHDELKVELRCTDVVDFNRPVLVRRIEVENLTDQEREVRLFHHHDFHMFGNKVGDTAYYDPQLRSVIHYRKSRYLMACFYTDGEQQTDEYACGTAGFGGAEGTWRDAEDGRLGNNSVAQGAVDSTIMTRVALAPGATRVVYLVIGAGFSYDDMETIHKFLHREGPQGSIDRTKAYWKLWLAASRTDFGTPEQTGLSEQVIDLFKRSMLLVRTQIDNQGAIIAANDSDIMQFSRDTYSYLWPRDGAFVADAMDAAGFPDVSRQFYRFCTSVLSHRGMFLHKYNPDGSPASSWHPWVDAKGRPQLPIQEDETALVVWAAWRHYVRYRDIEFTRPLWVDLVRPAADFMVQFRDPDTKLPLPSWDLWEERYGVHAFTVATVYGGLRSAWQFAVCFGDTARAQKYAEAAQEVREAFAKYMWSEEHGRFVRRICTTDVDRTARFMNDVFSGRTPQPAHHVDFASVGGGEPGQKLEADAVEVEHEIDDNIDASMFAIFAMGILPIDDERVAATMEKIEARLTVKTDVGGVARYEDDYYHQVTDDVENVPGNPWFICTLWMADYQIAKAKTVEELKAAAAYLEWVADRALPSGVLAEQVHPQTNAPLSVSPLTWSHATVVATVSQYLAKLEVLSPPSSAGAGSGAIAKSMDEAGFTNTDRLRTSVLEPVPEM